MTLPLAGSVVPVISHNLFDLGSIGNPHIPERPVVVYRQGSYRLFDLSLATPLCLPSCDGAPDHGQPARLDKSVSVDLAHRRREAIPGGWLSGSKCSSIRAGSWRCRTSSSLAITVTGVIATQCNE